MNVFNSFLKTLNLLCLLQVINATPMSSSTTLTQKDTFLTVISEIAVGEVRKVSM